MQSNANTKLAENCIEQPGVCIYDPSNPDGVCNEDHCKACSMPRKVSAHSSIHPPRTLNRDVPIGQ